MNIGIHNGGQIRLRNGSSCCSAANASTRMSSTMPVDRRKDVWHCVENCVHLVDLCITWDRTAAVGFGYIGVIRALAIDAERAQAMPFVFG